MAKVLKMIDLFYFKVYSGFFYLFDTS